MEKIARLVMIKKKNKNKKIFSEVALDWLEQEVTPSCPPCPL
jgi:hypothetical protein